MATEQRDLVTKDDLLRVENGLRAELRQVKEDLQAALRQVKDDMRAELGHYATKGDLWRGIAFQTIAFTAIVAALTKL